MRQHAHTRANKHTNTLAHPRKFPHKHRRAIDTHRERERDSETHKRPRTGILEETVELLVDVVEGVGRGEGFGQLPLGGAALG